MKNLKITTLLLVTGLCAFASVAHAATLIDITDTLTGSGYLAYDPYGHTGGSTPPVEIGASSAWHEDNYAQWTRTATGSVSGDGIGDAYLNVPTVVSGNIYTLSVTASSASGTEVELGFIDLETEGEGGLPRVNDVNGPDIAVIPGSNASNRLTLILNTTGTHWTLDAFDNGVEQGSLITFSTNPSGLDAVEISDNNTAPVFTAFSYTVATAPEPSSWALVVLGVGSLGFYFRLRSRRA